MNQYCTPGADLRVLLQIWIRERNAHILTTLVQRPPGGLQRAHTNNELPWECWMFLSGGGLAGAQTACCIPAKFRQMPTGSTGIRILRGGTWCFSGSKKEREQKSRFPFPLKRPTQKWIKAVTLTIARITRLLVVPRVTDQGTFIVHLKKPRQWLTRHRQEWRCRDALLFPIIKISVQQSQYLHGLCFSIKTN